MRYILSLFFILVSFGTPSAIAQPLDALVQEAILDFEFQDNEEAETKFKRILELAEGNVTAHYYLGSLLMLKGEINQAIAHFEYVFNAPVHINDIEETLANAYETAGQLEKALIIYEDLHKADPSNDIHTFQYAKILQNTNHTDHAKELYKQMIDEESPYTAASYYQLGLFSYGLGSFVTAYDSFEAVDSTSSYGAAAKQYMDSISPMINPLNIYVSGQFFHTDNASGSSNVDRNINEASGLKQSGYGWTLVGALSSREFEITDTIRIKLAYLYNGILYITDGLRSSDFISHFINPIISYQPSQTLDFELKGDHQFFNYGHQSLNKNYGFTLTTNKRFSSNPHSIQLIMAYLKKEYTNQYTTQNNQTTSLQYLNSNNYSVGLGATMKSNWGASLTANYKFGDEKTTQNTNQARDARFRDHTISANAYIPLSEKTFGKFLSKFTFIPNIGYVKQDYINPQSVDTFYDRDGDPNTNDLLIGQKVYSKTSTIGLQLSALLSQKMGLSLTGGYEYYNSISNASSLNIKYNKYFTSLAGSF